MACISEPASDQLQIQWDLANRNTRVCAEIYQPRKALQEIATGVRLFCENSRCSYQYVAGSDNPADNSGYFFYLRVYALDGLGSVCIHVRYTNHRQLPYRQTADFCIQTDSDAVLRLRDLLNDFSQQPHGPIHWCERVDS